MIGIGAWESLFFARKRGPLFFASLKLFQKTDAAKCEVLLRGGGADLFWTFGNKLWESYCVILDYGKRRVGFASL